MNDIASKTLDNSMTSLDCSRFRYEDPLMRHVPGCRNRAAGYQGWLQAPSGGTITGERRLTAARVRLLPGGHRISQSPLNIDRKLLKNDELIMLISVLEYY